MTKGIYYTTEAAATADAAAIMEKNGFAAAGSREKRMTVLSVGDLSHTQAGALR
jgi:hypothetical protein